MILEEYVEAKLNGSNIKYYESLGYEIPRYKNSDGRMVVKQGQTISVNVKDLSCGSHTVIHAKCDLCGEINVISYKGYLKNIKQYGIYTCKGCKHVKIKMTCLSRYGVESPVQLEEVKEKMRKTNIERYGVANALQNKEIKNKMNKTVMEKYGVNNVSQLEESREKVKQTNLQKYGNENYLLTSDYKEKTYKTYAQKYGTGIYHNMQIPEVREKARKSMYKNGKCATSKQQSYICNLYDMELNYPFMNYNYDIYDTKYGIDIEYDGSGHQMSVDMGKIDKQSFKQKENVRDIYSKFNKTRIMRIISKQDKLPSDEKLLEMLDISRKLFTNYSTVIGCTSVFWDIDNGSYTTYPSKELYPFDYGKLRKIT